MSKSLETLEGWGRWPGGDHGIYIHWYTFWRDGGCPLVSAAALELPLQRSSMSTRFLRSFKTSIPQCVLRELRIIGGMYGV